MNRLFVLAASTGVVIAVAAGCSSNSTHSSATTSSSTPPSTSSGPATVKTAGSPLGQILVDGSGRTLYLFKADTGTTSTCTGTCANLWPADTTTGTPRAGAGLGGTMPGTSMRSDDHKNQVTFHGHPLYYFSKDAKPGDVSGQGIQGVWFVVSPSGSAITGAPSQTPSTGGGGYGY